MTVVIRPKVTHNHSPINSVPLFQFETRIKNHKLFHKSISGKVDNNREIRHFTTTSNQY